MTAAMFVNIYRSGSSSTRPLRTRIFFRNAHEAMSYCLWWERTYHEKVCYVIVR